MTDGPCYVGCDVSLDTLDLCILSSGQTAALRVANNPQAITDLIHELVTRSGVLVILEASGGYEAALLDALWQADIPVARVDPRRVRREGPLLSGPGDPDSAPCRSRPRTVGFKPPTGASCASSCEQPSQFHHRKLHRSTLPLDLLDELEGRTGVSLSFAVRVDCLEIEVLSVQLSACHRPGPLAVHARREEAKEVIEGVLLQRAPLRHLEVGQVVVPDPLGPPALGEEEKVCLYACPGGDEGARCGSWWVRPPQPHSIGTLPAAVASRCRHGCPPTQKLPLSPPSRSLPPSVVHEPPFGRELLEEVELVAVGREHSQAGPCRREQDQRVVEALLALVALKTLRSRQRACHEPRLGPSRRVGHEQPRGRHGRN